MKTLVALLLVVFSVSASATAMQYSLCTLNDGKTMMDAQAWLDNWRKLAAAEKIDYEIRLLIPHASTDVIGQFYIEGSSPTLSSYAKAWEWWYSDADALKSNDGLESVAACGANSIYVSTD
jgi:hypothetical protein